MPAHVLAHMGKAVAQTRDSINEMAKTRRMTRVFI
jgi:hypothetical protein